MLTKVTRPFACAGTWSSDPFVDRLSVVTIVTGALWIASLANAYNFMNGIDGLGAAAMLVWPFLFDTGLTFIRRLARGESRNGTPRTHLYQRLVATGLRHSQVSVTYMALAALARPSAIAAGDVGEGSA